MNAAQLVKEFRASNPNLIESDDEDDQIFTDHIYQK